MDKLFVVCATLGAALLAYAVVLLVLSGFSTQRITLAFRCELRALRDAAFGDRVKALLEPPPKTDKPSKPSGEPLRLLALLQREGRLIDFLLEEIQSYSDAEVGVAVRTIHQKCQAVLKEHVTLAPVLPQAEGSTVEVAQGFDPSAVRLTGNVTGQPPFRGTIQHHGWRATEIKLAPIPMGQDELVLAPAEVELP